MLKVRRLKRSHSAALKLGIQNPETEEEVASQPKKTAARETRVNLASGLKLALVYKQISQVGLPYHPGQLYFQFYYTISE